MARNQVMYIDKDSLGLFKLSPFIFSHYNHGIEYQLFLAFRRQDSASWLIVVCKAPTSRDLRIHHFLTFFGSFKFTDDEIIPIFKVHLFQ